jgi:hypothetical protein
MTKNWKKFTVGNLFTYFFDQKLQFNNPYASLKDAQATGETFNLKREHPALQTMKILNFFLFFGGSFLTSWIRISAKLKLMRIPKTLPGWSVSAG